MGVVPVMSSVGGQPELVTPDCGVLIPLGDREVEEYVAALRSLIENPETRGAMAQASRQRVARSFSLHNTISHLTAILEHARTLTRSDPRPLIPPGLALELATQAVEYARLTTSPPLPTRLAKTLAMMRNYKFGRVVLRAKLVRAVGQWILVRIRDRRR